MKATFEIEALGHAPVHHTTTARTAKEAFEKLQAFFDRTDDEVALNWHEVRVRLVRTPVAAQRGET